MIETVRYDDRDWVVVDVSGPWTVDDAGWVTDPPDIWEAT